MTETIASFFEAGGVIMYILLGVSVVSLAAIIERLIYWSRRPTRREMRALERYASLCASGRRDAALEIARDDRSVQGRLVLETLAHAEPREELVLVAIEGLRPRFERFGALLGVVIAGAPLLGILGTVVGIIESFDLLGKASGVSDPAVIAGGIAKALYTTAAGLSIALVTLLPAALFRARAASTLSRLESLGAAITARDA